jgi:hypothetical protein
MGILDSILPKQKETVVYSPDHIEEPPIKLYNHIEITNEYKEYRKGKKSYEIQDFHIWLLETYPNMLFLKRDN